MRWGSLFFENAVCMFVNPVIVMRVIMARVPIFLALLIFSRVSQPENWI